MNCFHPLPPYLASARTTRSPLGSRTLRHRPRPPRLGFAVVAASMSSLAKILVTRAQVRRPWRYVRISENLRSITEQHVGCRTRTRPELSQPSLIKSLIGRNILGGEL